MNDTIYRQAAIDVLKGFEFCHYMEFGECIDEDTRAVRLIRAEKAQDALQNLPSAQPEPCEYMVSAIAVEEMLKDLLPERGMWEIEGDEAKTAICETVHDALCGLWKLPFIKPDSKEMSFTHKALDTISRQKALDDIETVDPSMILDVDWVKNWVKVLPSAQPEPERKKGKWIYDGDCYICDQCKSTFGWWADSQTSNYCPNCGAYMKEGEAND